MMNRIRNLQELVQDAIDKGATTVEEVHRSIASLPFEQLQKIAILEGPSQKALDLTEQSIGAVYDAIRNLNQRAGKMARDLLDKLDRSTPSHKGGRGRGRARTTGRRRRKTK
jgi:hypothetical protein